MGMKDISDMASVHEWCFVGLIDVNFLHLHKSHLPKFRRQLKGKSSTLGGQLGLMAPDGALETFS
jgi:hypothetical protein